MSEQQATNEGYVNNMLDGLKKDFTKVLNTHPELHQKLTDFVLAIGINMANIDMEPSKAAQRLADLKALVAGATLCFENPEIPGPAAQAGQNEQIGQLGRFLEIVGRTVGQTGQTDSGVNVTGRRSIPVSHSDR